eukprot:TRINITY_DN6714_c0_g1_i3.p1 TRINITY_DN6714_c0_g1~~TRINITY_DN6714_c0_g1_i3.p1  ORF type:complete len:118 (+),score=20.47 TRINITY_DN6714_c0_g1_i3:307-660(+)
MSRWSSLLSLNLLSNLFAEDTAAGEADHRLNSSATAARLIWKGRKSPRSRRSFLSTCSSMASISSSRSLPWYSLSICRYACAHVLPMSALRSTSCPCSVKSLVISNSSQSASWTIVV